MITHFITEDGSSSLRNEILQESYHSRREALEESRHVFIKHGLDFYLERFGKPSQIRVVELGFGTGLNALLTWKWAEEHQLMVDYLSIEKYPLEQAIWSQLNYHILLEDQQKGAEDRLQTLHQLSWNPLHQLSTCFYFQKMQEDWFDFLDTLKSPVIDILFYDAFAPSKQPELWTKEALTKVVSQFHSPAMFVTYCAMGQFKRDLKSLGLEVTNPPGPTGRKEMTVGIY